eukprot:TRINITY_DN15114_c0_g1_i1.p1 TRINITY_DN15114_c0_g1~~TRINITY_DN15114_c0_g1_i1.p1  ORF type:complete len:133 (-),score=11.39 TRINITY_DN15114_c0_g1_i1:33-431(-)
MTILCLINKYWNMDSQTIIYAPALNLLMKIVMGMDSWLRAHPQNVAVVHCLAGKGRTGTIICSYLLYIAKYSNPNSAINYFAQKRSCMSLGVEQPSQKRYVKYFYKVITEKCVPTLKTRYLRKLIMLSLIHI